MFLRRSRWQRSEPGKFHAVAISRDRRCIRGFIHVTSLWVQLQVTTNAHFLPHNRSQRLISMLSLPSECILNILARLPLADVVATASCCTGEWLVLPQHRRRSRTPPPPLTRHPASIHSPAPGGRRRLLLGSPGRGQMGRRCAAAKDSLRNRCALAELLLQAHVGTHDQVQALTRVVRQTTTLLHAAAL